MKIVFWLPFRAFATAGLIAGLKEILNDDFLAIVKLNEQVSRNNVEIASSQADCCFVKSEEEGVSIVKEKGFDTENSFHIINGFDGFGKNELMRLKKEGCLLSVWVYTEMASPMGLFKKIKSFLLLLKYRLVCKSESSQIDGLLPLGEQGRKFYRLSGWKKPIVVSQYLPLIDESSKKEKPDWPCKKFVYVGRNDFQNKGLNKILRYFGKHSELSLDIIGDYGKDSVKVTNWSNSHSNIRQIKSTPTNEVFATLCSGKYCCVLVPSNTEGWNFTPYLAMMAGIPCICTDVCGSSDLIYKYKCGLVCGTKAREFNKALDQFVYSSRETFESYCQNASKAIFDNTRAEIAKRLVTRLKAY